MGSLIEDEDVLDLSDIIPDRKQVRFETDGPLYDMVLPDELSIVERARLMQLHRLLEKLNNRPNLSRAEAEKMTRAMNEAARLVLKDISDEDFRRISDFKKEAVVLGFMSAFGNAMMKLAEATGGPDLAMALAASTPSES